MKANLKALLATIGFLGLLTIVSIFSFKYPHVAAPILLVTSLSFMTWGVFKAFQSIFKKD
jgi:hypothetical protein